MGIWTLDGVVWHSQLLQFALRENSVSDTVAMIIIDLSQPWNVLESLERWTQVLNKHVNSLKIPEKTRKTMEEDSELYTLSSHHVVPLIVDMY